MTRQEENEAILLSLWRMGEEIFKPLTAMVERSEREAYLLPCPCPDSTGRYLCNAPAVVFHRELEVAMCLDCFEVRP